jgi:hypothetical protein
MAFALGILVGRGLAGSPLAGQTMPGPEKETKAAVVEHGARAAILSGAEWVNWSEDEVVARLLHAPLKALGLRRFDREVRPALKALLDEAETRVRAVVVAREGGAIDLVTARGALQDALADYYVGVEILRAR